jgi:hypothetical protein
MYAPWRHYGQSRRVGSGLRGFEGSTNGGEDPAVSFVCATLFEFALTNVTARFHANLPFLVSPNNQKLNPNPTRGSIPIPSSRADFITVCNPF